MSKVDETQRRRMVEILMNYASIGRSKARYIVKIMIDELAITKPSQDVNLRDFKG